MSIPFMSSDSGPPILNLAGIQVNHLHMDGIGWKGRKRRIVGWEMSANRALRIGGWFLFLNKNI